MPVEPVGDPHYDSIDKAFHVTGVGLGLSQSRDDGWKEFIFGLLKVR